MKFSWKNVSVILTLITALMIAAAPYAAAQFEPMVGQEGKDVIWVPTPEGLIKEMLDMAKVTALDYVIDLGSGDGRIVVASAKRGARALGVEYNPDMVDLSKSNAEKAGVSARATFVNADIFETDFTQATVITMYLLPHLNLKLRPKILDMKPGTRVVSHAFTMDDWEPDQTAVAEHRTAYLWIVPAKVAGAWSWQAGNGRVELALKQTFQKIDGSLKIGGKELAMMNSRLVGDRLNFTVEAGGQGGRQEYSGTVKGNTIEGLIKSAAAPDLKWTATR
jgi:precorrin-6B methylase 2